MGDRQWFVLYVLVCLEIGVFLILVPWSVIWERNYFLQLLPDAGRFMLNPVLRGAVSGLGLANLYVGLGEVLRRRGGVETASGNSPEPQEDASFSQRASSHESSGAGPRQPGQEDTRREALVTNEERT